MGTILIFTGKGGVGKTSVAAAHAMLSVGDGRKTLLVSTDMAHNLGDLFELTLGSEITALDNGLHLLEINPHDVMENDFKDMKQAFLRLVASSGMASEQLEQIAVFPGMDELFSLLKILSLHQSGHYDRIIVDCAPTGETLALLKFPELLSWYMEKMFPIGKAALRILSPISKTVFKVQLPDRQAMTDIERLYVTLLEFQTLLKDPATTAIRLVTIPEKMVVEETKRNFMYLNLYGFNVDCLFINRILPQDLNNPFFDEWIAIQTRYTEELESLFTGRTIRRIPWFDSDLNGVGGIGRLAEILAESSPLFELQPPSAGEHYEKTETGYALVLDLPFVEKGDIRFNESATDLILKIGNFKRSIPKPATLRHYLVNSAKLTDGKLTVRFEPK
ncbi:MULTISPECIES: ArsA family ATPase [Dehalobacter]|jgi:arsenite-transporting ATPase|uniref:arsenite-transporting ATPase n=2 Tax=Dehalobacter restrictus TaxID=55583 RepID=A0A857DGX1_9FIRM|nr:MULTISPECIES: ArsA family ATPase [Dehalobacter]AHF09326.1 arsenic transporter ATPase [Dehalobacter restrictus DSM 9455]MCG1025212.1 ArsA family ATPase [Dehalobacter sp.]MDJ0305802.1 ArsA family ATPase [Dehalobacter sp.]OCZ52254.1 arsenic-transporting ATPase [Dehalobacter sp. TeCB1]QGZ99867.1 TRC40/GET3/ArsA family transport-energizing ATPase [Dehalobacter restrictus]